MTTNYPPVPKEDDGDSKKAKSIADIIPSVYYDVIARICPGAGFWITISLVSQDVQQVFKVDKVTGTSLFILVLISYLAGIVLSGFCIIWDLISFKLLAATTWLSDPLRLDKKIGLIKQWQIVAQRMETVAKVSQDPSRIVTKALAEVTLCENLITGLIVLGAIGFTSRGKHFYDPRDEWLTYLIVGVAFVMSMLFRQAMLLGRTHAIYEMYVSSKKED
jgi:hypothetical protein